MTEIAIPHATEPAHPESLNALLASGAATVAQLILDHDEPTLARISLDTLNFTPASPHPLRAHLQISGTDQLADVLAWAEALAGLDEHARITVTHRRGYVSLDAHAEIHELPVTVWTHLTGEPLAAVWAQFDDPPSLDATATVSPELLRAATGQVSS